MEGKRKSKGRLSGLERALRSLHGWFPGMRIERGVLFVGSDGILVSKRGEKKLRLRFWTGAHTTYRQKLVEALDQAGVPYEVGPEYELENRGRKVEPKGMTRLLEEVAEYGIGRLERNDHVKACLLCKDLLDQASSADQEYQGQVYATVAAHIKATSVAQAPPCQYSGCVHHEDITRELSRALLKLARGSKPWKDARGVPVSTMPLLVTREDHPEGWIFQAQDAESRHFKDLFVEEGGTIYVRLAPKRVTVHVWITPQYKTKHEKVEDPATIDDVLETHDKRVPSLREWAMKKYGYLKGLAEMDLQL